jgi:hypothetical protein
MPANPAPRGKPRNLREPLPFRAKRGRASHFDLRGPPLRCILCVLCVSALVSLCSVLSVYPELRRVLRLRAHCIKAFQQPTLTVPMEHARSLTKPRTHAWQAHRAVLARRKFSLLRPAVPPASLSKQSTYIRTTPHRLLLPDMLPSTMRFIKRTSCSFWVQSRDNRAPLSHIKSARLLVARRMQVVIAVPGSRISRGNAFKEGLTQEHS